MNSKQQLTMESLDLPRELYWDMKLEPASPPLAVASELFALNDPSAYLIYDDNFANGITLMSVEEEDTLKETGSLLSDEDFVVEFLDQIDEECLIDYKSTDFLDVVPQDVQPITKVQVAASAADYQQGESSLILQQLTPPQSPPQFDAYQQQQQQLQQQQEQEQEQEQELVKQEHKLLSYATDATAAAATTATAAAAASAPNAYNNYNNWAPYSEITPETQLVDDIVSMRAQELQLPIDWQQYNDDCESQASSSHGSGSSSSSSCGSSSVGNSGVGSGSGSSIADADEEWLPLGSSSSPAHNVTEEQLSTSASESASSGRGSAKKRTRTYGRGVEDRKIRKKEQNKNAATRYRQKKKLEMEHVLDEEQKLAQANDALRRTLTERRHESRYLRQLIREFYKERKP